MATKSAILRQDYDASSVVKGRAKTSDKQASNFTFGQNSNRLRADLIYVIPRQWAHIEKVNVRDVVRDSVKVYAVGVNQDGVALMTTTLSLNGLTQRHYGDAADNLKVEAIKNEKGLYRMSPGVRQTSVFAKGTTPIKVVKDGDDNYAYIPRDFAFQVTDRGDKLITTFSQVSGTNDWNIDHYKEDGKELVKFSPATLNTYEEVDKVPELDPAIVCEGFIDTYQKDLPNE